jgi:hypothetical protein
MTVPPPAPEQAVWQTPPPEPAEDAAAASPPRRRRNWLVAAGLLLAGALAGGGIALAATHGHGDPHGVTRGAAVDGPPNGAPPGGFGPAGGVAGEQHLIGTLTAIGNSTVTVKSATGTATYKITSTTQIVRNGSAATLSQLKVGDPVVVHVLPSSAGTKAVERIYAGSLPAEDPGERAPGEPADGGPHQ